MFASLGRFIYRARWYVLLAGLLFVAASGVFGTSVFGKLKNGGFYDPDAESTRVMNALHDNLGHDEDSLIVLFTATDGTKVDDASYKAAVESTLGKLKGQDGIGAITDFYNTGSQALVSNDHQSTYAVVGFKGDEAAQTVTMERVRPLLTGDQRWQVKLGGI